jgi:hypothetical protein
LSPWHNRRYRRRAGTYRSGLAAAIARRVVAGDLPMAWPCRAVLPVESRIRASDRLERLFATRFVPWRPIGFAALFDVGPFDADVVDHKSDGPRLSVSSRTAEQGGALMRSSNPPIPAAF